MRFVSISIGDQSGQPVLATVTDGTHSYQICGATPAPVAIKKGAPVTVALFDGQCSDGSTNSFVTSGVIAAKFRSVR